jgi:Glycosyltransferase Family 4
MAASLSIAHVTPYPWEESHEVNTYVRLLSAGLSRHGHRVLILAPSRSAERVRASRRALRTARAQPAALLSGTDTGSPNVIAVGEVLEVSPTARRRTGALPIDVARTIEELLGAIELDIVHLHEPFAPSASSAALRHSRSLNVGSFHAPTDHLLSTQVARRFVETFFGRLDARVASFQATAQLMERHFPSDYRVIMAGVEDNDAKHPGNARDDPAAGPVSLLYIEHEERPALRLLLRALRHLRTNADWRLTIASTRGDSSITPLRASLRANVRFVDPGELS